VRCDELELKDNHDLERRWPKDDEWVVALEVAGKALTSTAFSEHLERWGSTGKGNVTFVIGGAEGIPPALSARSRATLSLSTMTLPHRLARVLLLEQLYRGLSILRNEPYARE
jgi:23S rRNA (pseudouridine1915-N3)-methyltransferase